ncbi:MAG: hypothetical protein HFP81_03815 [Methylococcales symbiont of Hymedesmia sp. n. MRB-2018]|nr:MAG: hypothetical protein HFP78_07185 [Methylococcales symbiont of Hymedesmia sp. n. MRB-2018]KAF3984096.1 MAG: hypothetical protein HFP81_03815 [Methylococcales symbiont of Hymedesmia sp. n. MRB-2018]
MNSIVLYLIAIVLISVIIAWLISHSKQAEKAVKIMTFMIYFWLSAFVQLIVFALLYHYKILA